MTDDHSRLPADITPSFGSDELNLIDFPIGLLQHQQPKGRDESSPDELVCTIDSYDAELDRVVPRTLTRRTSSKFGFPTPVDEEVLIGLLTLTRRQNSFTSPLLKFRNRELYELMGWHNNGRARRRLSQAFDRLKGLDLKYENSWSSDNERYEKEFSTGLLDSYELVSRVDSDTDSSTESWIRWAAEVFADMQRGNVKELDTKQFFSLRRPVARRLYRFLDKYLQDNKPFEIELAKLATQMGISDTTHVGKIKERLTEGIRELEELGDFIKPAPREQRYSKKRAGLWLIRFERVGSEFVQPKVDGGPAAKGKPKATPVEGAQKLVVDFYALWSGDQHHVATRNEQFRASEIVRRWGSEKANALLPIVVKAMKKSFPDAHSFGATTNFWPVANDQLVRQDKRTAEASERQEQQKREEERAKAQKAKIASQRKRFSELPDAQQAAIRARILKSPLSGETLKSFIRQGKYDDPLVMLACLAELNR